MHSCAESSPAEPDSIDAALRCIARWGVAKTTLDDVAREAGCSRATVYRVFPGGKDEPARRPPSRRGRPLLRPSARRRSTRADDLEDLLVAGITDGRPRTSRDHAALQFLLAHEPELVLPAPRVPPARRSCSPRPPRSPPRTSPPHVGDRRGAGAPPSGSPASSSPTRSARPTASTSPTRTTPAASCAASSCPGSSTRPDPDLRHEGADHHGIHRGHHRPRRHQRPRGDPRDHQHRRRRGRSTRCKDNADAIFTWDYERSRPALGKLYEKAKTSQWNGETDLDWTIEVDQEEVVLANARPATAASSARASTSTGTPFEKWGDEGVDPARHRVAELDARRSSCTASRARCSAPRKIVETVPWIDAKYYARRR